MKKFLNNLKRFFRAVGRSCYDMEYYRGIRQGRWQRSAAYFLSWCGLYAIVGIAIMLPGLLAAPGLLRAQIDKSVPAGAGIAVKAGQLEVTNLPMPAELGSKEMPFTVDTSVTGLTVPDSLKEKTGILVGRDALFAHEDTGRWQVQSFKEIKKDFSITKEAAMGWLDRSGSWVAALVALLALLTMFAFSVLSIGLYAGAGAAVAMLVSRFWGIRLNYPQWLAVALHAVTLPMAVSFLLGLMNINIPSAFSFIFFMFAVAVVADERARPTVKGAEAAAKPDQSGDAADKDLPKPPAPPDHLA